RRIYSKQRDAGGIVPLAGGTRADDQELHAVAVQNHVFGAVEQPASAVGLGCRQYIAQIVPRLPLAMGKGEDHVAFGNLRQARRGRSAASRTRNGRRAVGRPSRATAAALRSNRNPSVTPSSSPGSTR